MLSPAVLFTVLAIGLQVFVVNSNPAHEIDLRTILQLAQQQVLKDRQPFNDDKSESVSKERYNSNYGSLSSNEVLRLIQKSTLNRGQRDYKDLDDRKDGVTYKFRNKNNPDSETYGHYKRYELNNNKADDDYRYLLSALNRDASKDDDGRSDRNRFNQRALEELLSQNVLGNRYKDRPRQGVALSTLVGNYDLNPKSVKSGGDYSKVYVILNPKAIEKSKNKDELNNLLVKILSLTASSLGREQGKRIKERRYKGFQEKAGLLTRRARRDSREMYGGKDAEEDDYKQKRPRNNGGGGGGGGGGGAGGRTAIPYIRHRGDIYERDN